MAYKNTHFVGKAGEFAVASQLLIRGIPVHFPAVDTGVDLIAGERIRIQIKSGHKYEGRKGYTFAMSSLVPSAKTGTYRTKFRDWSKATDFMIFWGIDENRFWIVPSHVFREGRPVQTLLLGAPSRHWTINGDEVRALLKTGITQREAADRLGISEMSVSKVARGLGATSQRSVCVDANKYEGAWHEIIAAIGLVTQVDSSSRVEKMEGEFKNA